MKCVVVGAGLAGLAAAWELQRAGAEVVVLESARRAGGMIVTERRAGFVVEGGPDGFLAAEPDIQDLARALNIGDRIVDQVVKGAMLWTGGRLEALPEGRAAELLGIQGHAEHVLDRGFRSFRGGMGEIVDALFTRLGPAVRMNQGVTAIAPAVRGWRLAVTGGSAHEGAAVILAVPGWVAARFLVDAGVAVGRELGAVVYQPSTTVSLAYRVDQIAGNLAGTGFVAAPESRAVVRACTYAWLKYPERAPPGHALLRAFVGPVDGDPGALAHAELAAVLRLTGAPLWTRAFYWSRGLPRYTPGHAARVAAIRARLARLAPLDIAGAAVDGAGVSACVQSGRAAARRVIEWAGGPADPGCR